MTNTGYQTFEELEVWKSARQLKNEIYSLVKIFPGDERYRLVDQLIRSSRSVNGQITEGHGRRTYPDRIRFCVQARGSLIETLNHLIDAYDCEYIPLNKLDYFRTRIAHVEKLLNGYISWLDKKASAIPTFQP